MLTNEEHQAMIMFDRLLMAAKENETVADLLDQTLNVARMLDPRPDDKVVYGPLQRMHFEWQQMRHRMNQLESKMDNYINSQNRYGVPPSSWPSNPGMQSPMGYPQTITKDTTGYHPGYVPSSTFTIGASGDVGMGITALTVEDIKRMTGEMIQKTEAKPNLDQQMERLREQLRNITSKVSSEDNDITPASKAK